MPSRCRTMVSCGFGSLRIAYPLEEQVFLFLRELIIIIFLIFTTFIILSVVPSISLYIQHAVIARKIRKSIVIAAYNS